MFRTRLLRLCAVFSAAFLIAALSLVAPCRADGSVYQVSTINALLDGVYDGDTTLGELKQHGDFGLGTFNGLAGEMILLDGQVYQALVDGTVRKPEDFESTPFASVTKFDADQTLKLNPGDSLSDLCQSLDLLLPTMNIFYAVRLDGTFPRMKVRSVPKQKQPYPPLAEVVKTGQAVFEYQNIEGTMVGLRCPEFAKGINVSGWHWHFISKDRTKGGHVLDCVRPQLNARMDFIRGLKLALPGPGAYDEAGLGHDRDGELHAVEKGRQ